MIVRLKLVFLPHHERRAADKEDIFAVCGGSGRRLNGGRHRQEKQEQEESFHQEYREQYLC
jgi:hypothetical protein